MITWNRWPGGRLHLGEAHRADRQLLPWAGVQPRLLPAGLLSKLTRNNATLTDLNKSTSSIQPTMQVCRDIEEEVCSGGSPAACNTVVEEKCETEYQTTIVDKWVTSGRNRTWRVNEKIPQVRECSKGDVHTSGGRGMQRRDGGSL